MYKSPYPVNITISAETLLVMNEFLQHIKLDDATKWSRHVAETLISWEGMEYQEIIAHFQNELGKPEIEILVTEQDGFEFKLK